MNRIITPVLFLLITMALILSAYYCIDKYVVKSDDTLYSANYKTNPVAMNYADSYETMSLIERASQIANWKEFGEILYLAAADTEQKIDKEELKKRISESLENWKKVHYKKGEFDLLWVLNKEGFGVGSITDTAWEGMDQRQSYSAVNKLYNFPALQDVLSDIWLYYDHVVKIGVAKIRYLEKPVGMVLIGKTINDRMAGKLKEMSNGDILYLLGEKIIAKSVSNAKLPDIKKEILRLNLKDAASSGSRLNNLRLTVSGHIYHGDYFPITKTASAHNLGMLVLIPFRDQKAVLNTITHSLILAGVISLIGVLLIFFLLQLRAHKPFEEIEAGINEVLNGNEDFRFKGSAKGPLLYVVTALNALLDSIFGKKYTEDEIFEGGWAEPLFIEDIDALPEHIPIGTDAQEGVVTISPEEIKKIEAEPEDIYLKRLYEEYSSARAAIGDLPNGFSAENFQLKIEKNAGALKEKNQVRLVRFQVIKRGNKVILKPILFK